jgi:outer membrane protein assembly factor BamB
MSGSIGAISDDVVYVTAQTRSTGNVYAINAKDGKVIWNYTGSALSAPAEANGIVFFGGEGAISALNASNGDKVWDYQTDGRVETSPAVAQGIVYASSYNGAFYALNASKGEEVWVYPAGGYSSPAVANGIVYFGSYKNVYALNASTGSEIWNYTTMYLVDSSPIVAKEAVYVGSDDGNLYALNAYSGSKLWNYSIQPYLDEHGLDRYLFASPEVFNETIYMGSNDGVIYALQENLNQPKATNAETQPNIPAYTVVIVAAVLFVFAVLSFLVLKKRQAGKKSTETAMLM